MNLSWGMFGPDQVASRRRLQTLGLGPVVRHFNDRSVPGLGGLWFGMPVAWSLLGIELAGKERRPLPVATAIEAAIMVQALGRNRERARGSRKLARHTRPVFKVLSVPGAYVSQPYRMGAVEPLLQLGLVDGPAQRFNLYRLNSVGRELLECYRKESARLAAWIKDDDAGLMYLNAIAPDQRLRAKSAKLLHKQLREHGSSDYSSRRRRLLDLSRGMEISDPLAEQRPDEITPDHWSDLRSGVALVRLRQTAIAVLSEVEILLGSVTGRSVSPADAADAVRDQLEILVAAASVMLAEADATGQAHAFARSCLDADRATVISHLAERDGVVIRLMLGGRLTRGPAAGGSQTITGETHQPSADSGWIPELPRVGNLVALNRDLRNGISS